jgi:putative NIF3 family GTP cyclohydrolase 1 type 2
MKEIPLGKLVSLLDAALCLDQFPEDESRNGLQVEGKEKIRKIGLAVDACGYVFEKAAEKKIDFLVVHHGLIWGGIKSVRGVVRERIKMLLDSGMSLYACHLPLDWHPEYGNNVELLRVLSIKRMGEFGAYHGKRIGYWGRTAKEMSVEQFASTVDGKLKTRSSWISFGRKVRNVGVVLPRR